MPAGHMQSQMQAQCKIYWGCGCVRYVDQGHTVWGWVARECACAVQTLTRQGGAC